MTNVMQALHIHGARSRNLNKPSNLNQYKGLGITAHSDVLPSVLFAQRWTLTNHLHGRDQPSQKV